MKYCTYLLLVVPIFSNTLYSMIGVCQQDASCESGFKGIVCSSSGFELNGCAEKIYCSKESVSPFEMHACQKDYTGKQCSSGACYFHNESLSCESTSACSNPGITVNLQCKACDDKGCETGNCQYSDGTYFKCHDSSTCSYQKITAENIKCSESSLHEHLKSPCQCCSLLKVTELTPENNAGVCTTHEASSFKDPLIAKYVKDNPDGDDGSTTGTCKQFSSIIFESSILYALTLLGLFFMMI